MLIKKIVLHNIRSYNDAEINFEPGKTLISGDIGSGKSTILLSIEFALFGLIKGEISGSILLRHGVNQGSVELHFEVEKKNFVVHRALKRISKSIEQDSGFLIINGRKNDLTSTELKAQIIDILGYPADLVAKSKSLLFRYTVYTPQEDMKQILFGDKNERLNIIRRIFGIDKYRRIKENSEVYSKHVREQWKELNGRTLDLYEKKSNLKSFETELLAAKTSFRNNEPIVLSAKILVENTRSKIADAEQSKKQLIAVQRNLDLCSISGQHLIGEKTNLLNEIQRISARIKVIESDIAGQIIEDSALIKQELSKQSVELDSLESERIKIITSNAKTETIQKTSSEIIQKMNSLDVCPLCMQKVDSNHKQSIISSENSKILSSKENFIQSINLQKELVTKISEKKIIIDSIKLKEKTVEILKFKQQSLIDLNKQLNLVNGRISAIEKEITAIVEKKKAVESEILKYASVDEHYAVAKKALDEALAKEKNAEITQNVLKEKITNAENNKILIEAEIKQKTEFLEKANKLKRLNQWIQELFCPLVDSIEKQVLARIYGEFNELFIKWFGLLVEDDFFSARLDDSFTPVLQQNGFDTLPENLSGGEKTACALAYRLALNKAINDIMSAVQTKDILILDEPTDGFSDAQLDKVGEVFDNLGLKQIVIVSHERKVENFVDKIIHINKTSHSSAVNT